MQLQGQEIDVTINGHTETKTIAACKVFHLADSTGTPVATLYFEDNTEATVKLGVLEGLGDE